MLNNFSSFEELRNNALRFKGGRSDPYEFDEESGACASNNAMVSNDYKLNTSISVIKVKLILLNIFILNNFLL